MPYKLIYEPRYEPYFKYAGYSSEESLRLNYGSNWYAIIGLYFALCQNEENTLLPVTIPVNCRDYLLETFIYGMEDKEYPSPLASLYDKDVTQPKVVLWFAKNVDNLKELNDLERKYGLKETRLVQLGELSHVVDCDEAFWYACSPRTSFYFGLLRKCLKGGENNSFIEKLGRPSPTLEAVMDALYNLKPTKFRGADPKHTSPSRGVYSNGSHINNGIFSALYYDNKYNIYGEELKNAVFKL
jgi:hypothetical protein